MRPFGRRTGSRLARVTAFAALAFALVVSGAGPAAANGGENGQPDSTGNNGTLKILAYGSTEASHDNEPQVCAFRVEGFDFDPGQELAITFLPQAPTKDLVPPAPNLYEVTADPTGYFITDEYGWFNGEGGAAFPAGHYKVVALGKDTGSGPWTELDKAKSKVFWVDCGTPAGGTGQISVTKALAEGSAPAQDKKFAITVACDDADYTETFHLKVGDTATTAALPTATLCTVSEQTTDGWENPAITPDDQVAVQENSTVAVTVTNFKPKPGGEGETGTVTVTKQLAEGSEPADGQTFPVTITCEKHDEVVHTDTFELGVGQSATTDPLPVGSKCTVSETPPDGWDTPTFEPSAMVTVRKGDVAVTVLNFKGAIPPDGGSGTVIVTKALADSSDDAGGLTFPLSVTCEKAGYSKTFEFTLAVGDSEELKGLPAGAVCTVSEDVPSGWDTPTYSPAAAVTVAKDAAVTVTVTNRRAAAPVASLSLTKANDPSESQLVQAGSTITYSLTVANTGEVAVSDVLVSDAVPAGTTYVTGSATCLDWTACTVTEPAATPLTVTWGLGTLNPGDHATVSFQVTVDAGLAPNTEIANVGTVTSSGPSEVSNEVVNRLTDVKGEVIVGPTTPATSAAVEGEALAYTGPGAPVGYLLGTGIGLVAVGALLTAATRRRRSA